MIGKEQALMLDAIVNKDFKENWKKVIVNGQVADGIRYEIMQELLSNGLSKAKKIGKLKFLDWLDGREDIPGKVVDEVTGQREKIALPEIFSWSGYIKVDRSILEGESSVKDTSIYTKAGSAVMPAVRESVEF